MSGRGPDSTDVTSGGKVVGFIVKPSQPGGKWHCYVDKSDGRSSHVGWAADAMAARWKVRRMAG